MDARLNAPGSDNGIRSIVVVEDSKDVADSIRYGLEHQGFRVWVEDTSQAALDLVLDHPPNRVLLDVNLPGKSGFELFRRFRAEAATRSGPRNYADSRTLDVHIRRLRAKLGNPNLIETITGVGYRLVGSRSRQT